VTKLASGALGLKYATMAMLTSPYFVYRVELGAPVAGSTNRSAHWRRDCLQAGLLLWNGPPDKALLIWEERRP